MNHQPSLASVELSGAKCGTPEADVKSVVELGSRISAMLFKLG